MSTFVIVSLFLQSPVSCCAFIVLSTPHISSLDLFLLLVSLSSFVLPRLPCFIQSVLLARNCLTLSLPPHYAPHVLLLHPQRTRHALINMLSPCMLRGANRVWETSKVGRKGCTNKDKERITIKIKRKNTKGGQHEGNSMKRDFEENGLTDAFIVIGLHKHTLPVVCHLQPTHVELIAAALRGFRKLKSAFLTCHLPSFSCRHIPTHTPKRQQLLSPLSSGGSFYYSV